MTRVLPSLKSIKLHLPRESSLVNPKDIFKEMAGKVAREVTQVPTSRMHPSASRPRRMVLAVDSSWVHIVGKGSMEPSQSLSLSLYLSVSLSLSLSINLILYIYLAIHAISLSLSLSSGHSLLSRVLWSASHVQDKAHLATRVVRHV